MDDLSLRRKLTLRAHGSQVVFIKKHRERLEHVLMKAFLWALYLPTYPDLSVEVGIGDRYKPDVVAVDPSGQPLFWGEAGKVSRDKIASLGKRYRHTHFAMAKWDTSLKPYADLVKDVLNGLKRTAPFDLIAFPPDSAARFIEANNEITLTHADLSTVTIILRDGNLALCSSKNAHAAASTFSLKP